MKKFKNILLVLFFLLCVPLPFMAEGEELEPNPEDEVLTIVEEAPVVTIEKGNNNSLNLTWQSVENADKYIIYRSTDKKKYTNITTTTNLVYTDSKLTYGTTYYYKVRAYNDSTKTYKETIVSKKVVPNQIVNLQVSSIATNSLKITWDKTSNTGYEVYSSIDNKKWTKVTTITKKTTVTYTNKSLKANTTYYYKVRVYSTVSGKKIYGEYSEVVTTKTSPAAPKVTLKTSGYNTINITTKKVGGAVTYQIYRATSKSGKYVLLNTLSELNYTDETAIPSVTYYYKVRACNSNNNCGTYSSIVSAKTTLGKPTITLTTSPTSITVNIKEVNGATGYEVYRSTSKSGKYTKVGTPYGLIQIDNNKTPNTTFYYKVRSFYEINNKKYYSAYSSIVSGKTELKKPTIKTEVTASTVRVSWNEVPLATGYIVYYATSKNGKYTALKTVKGETYYSHLSLVPNKTYYYKVLPYITYNSKNYNGSYSNVVSAKPTIKKVANLTAAPTDRTVSLSWDSITGAHGYFVERSSSSNGKYTVVADVMSSSHTDKNLIVDTKYYYRVRAYVKVGKTYYYGAYSEVVDTKTLQDEEVINEATELLNQLLVQYPYYNESQIRTLLSTNGYNTSIIDIVISNANVDWQTRYYNLLRSYITNRDSRATAIQNLRKNGVVEPESIVDLLGIDFLENTINAIEYYVNDQYFSYELLNIQLTNEGFTSSQISSALENFTFNFNEIAVSYANYYEENVEYVGKTRLQTMLELQLFTAENIVYVMENSDIDFNAYAVLAAKANTSNLGYNALIQVLRDTKGFTEEEAIYGVNNSEINFNQRALLKAQELINAYPYSEEGLRNELSSLGYTNDQIEYVLTNLDYEFSDDPIKSFIDANIYSKEYVINVLTEFGTFGTRSEIVEHIDSLTIDWAQKASQKAAEIFSDLISRGLDHYREDVALIFVNNNNFLFTEEEVAAALDSLTYPERDEIPEEEEVTNAIARANSLLEDNPYSKEGLIRVLKNIGYSDAVARAALNRMTIDFAYQARREAILISASDAKGRAGILKDLQNLLYTEEEIESGLDSANINYNDAAITYVSVRSAYPYSRLLLRQEMLSISGFTLEEANYGINNASIDWTAMATNRANYLIQDLLISKTRLSTVLSLEEFTEQEVTYVINNLDLDFKTIIRIWIEYYISDRVGYSRTLIQALLTQAQFETADIDEVLTEYANVDFNIVATYAAKNIIATEALSKAVLLDRLTNALYFTGDQARYAIDNSDIDYTEQAVRTINKLMSMGPTYYNSESGFHDLLLLSGFEELEANAALDAVDIDYYNNAFERAKVYLEDSTNNRLSATRDFITHLGFLAGEVDYAMEELEKTLRVLEFNGSIISDNENISSITDNVIIKLTSNNKLADVSSIKTYTFKNGLGLNDKYTILDEYSDMCDESGLCELIEKENMTGFDIVYDEYDEYLTIKNDIESDLPSVEYQEYESFVDYLVHKFSDYEKNDSLDD